MRIVSYNILDGGEGRADPLAETIEAQRPDIVVLVEADNLDVIERIGRRLHMDYIHGQGPSTHAAAILSRWSIVESINHAVLRRQPQSLLEATVRQPDGREWTVGALHLRPYAREEDERQRETELATVLDAFARHRKASRPHLLAGDFNSNSPIQQIDPALVKPSTREAWLANGNQIPRRVVQRLLDAGYIDTLAAVHPDHARTLGTFSTQHPGQRVDYIFAWGFPPTSIQRAWIEHDRLAKYASDHYPIGAEVA